MPNPIGIGVGHWPGRIGVGGRLRRKVPERDLQGDAHPRVLIDRLPAHERQPSTGFQAAAQIGERSDRFDEEHDAEA